MLRVYICIIAPERLKFHSGTLLHVHCKLIGALVMHRAGEKPVQRPVQCNNEVKISISLVLVLKPHFHSDMIYTLIGQITCPDNKVRMRWPDIISWASNLKRGQKLLNRGRYHEMPILLWVWKKAKWGKYSLFLYIAKILLARYWQYNTDERQKYIHVLYNMIEKDYEICLL